MRKLSWLFSISTLILLTLFSVLIISAQDNGKLKKSKRSIPNRYIVVLNDEIGKVNEIFKAPLQGEIIDRVTSDLAASYGGKIEKVYKRTIQGYAVEMTQDAAVKLSQDARVKYIEEDFVIRKEESQVSVPWGIDRIDQRNRPLDSYYNYDTTGAGIHAYVLDTGIRASHSEFGGRVVFGADFVNDGQNGNDCDGHGTHVAGILGGSTYGVAKNVTIHNVRVLNCKGEGEGSALLSAIEWVTANSVKPSVANMSLGSDEPSSVIENAIANSIAQGVNYALAAGNDNANACNNSPGGRVSMAITVGATQRDDSRWGDSNYGACVDIFAPGSEIFSAWNTGDNDVFIASGTSMATPHVAGMIARLLQANPSASPADIKNTIIGNATTGVISNAGAGSPNRLLYQNPGFSPPPPPKIVWGFSGTASPYPATYKVSGLSGVIANTPGSIKVKINGLNHVNPNRLALVLASPTGYPIMLQGGTGGSSAIRNGSYTISDDGAGYIPDTTIANGATYKPTARRLPVVSGTIGAGDYSNPGPINGGTATLTAAYADTNPNGDWKLFVVNENGGFGAILDWSLEITTVPQPPDPLYNVLPNGTSGFVGIDSFTKGNWSGKYGSELYYVGSGSIRELSGVKVTLPNLPMYNWGFTFDERIPQPMPYYTSPNGDQATLRYSPTQFDIDLEFTDGNSHRVAIYCMDFNGRNRSQTFEVINSDTGAVFDTRSLSNFNGGKYLIWQLKGRYKIRVRNNGGISPDAVYSALFVDPVLSVPNGGSTAKFINFDASTKGSWDTKYGEQGYYLMGYSSTLPAGTTMTTAGVNNFTWVNSTNDVRALPKFENYSERIAAAWYSSTQFETTIKFADSQVHRLALYSVDWDYKNRQQTIEIVQGETGQILDARTISDFGNGLYSVWDVSGIIKIRVKNAGGSNAVLSGIFLDPPPPPPPTYETAASFVGFDTNTKGNWVGKYGSEGRDVFYADYNLPAWGKYSFPRGPGNSPQIISPTYTTTDARALKMSPTNSNRIIAAYVAYTNIDMKFDFTDGQLHRVALYSVDWGGTTRKQTFEIINTTTGEILDSRTLENFSGGIYTIWKLRGRFTLRFKNAGGTPNAAISGLFIDQADTPLPVYTDTSASFLGEDINSQGNWVGNYGAEGYSIVNDATNMPATSQMSLSGQNAFTWSPSTTDLRALKKSGNNADRIASTYYTPTEMEMNFYFTDGLPHRLAIYNLDWESSTRQQTFELINPENDSILDTRTISNFNSGKYLVWNVKGKFKVRVKKIAGANASVSGIFIDPPSTSLPNQPPPVETIATYVGEDSYTKGNWVGNYGTAGGQVIGDTNNLPSFVRLNLAGQTPYMWMALTGDSRALRKISNNAERLASAFYTPNQMDLNFYLTDGQAHRIALYALDWEGSSRKQTFELVNTDTGAVLDTRTISTFGGGRYVAWNVKGKFTVRIKNAGGTPPNAVLSGIFFDTAGTPLPPAPPVIEPAASFVGADNYTKGNWTGNYGAEGKQIIGDAVALPAYTQLNITGQNPYTWAPITTDTRALKKASNNNERIASTFYTANQMDLNFDLTDGQTHRLSLYALDWEGNGRKQTFELLNTETGAILDTRTVNTFNGGLYLVWNVKGRVTVRVKNAGGAPPNAVLSGIFFDAAGMALPNPPAPDPTSAAFVRVDANARGNWLSSYGGQGYSIVNDATTLPAYAQLSVTNQSAFNWSASTTDGRALIKSANADDRIAATYYAPSQFEMNFNLTDGQTHRIALYAIDWEGNTRQETFELISTDSGTVLDTRTISNFNTGVYVVWEVKGKVTVRVKKVAGPNAVLSGVFFDSLTADETTGGFVGFNANAQGNWMGAFGGQGYSIINDRNNLPAYARMTASGQNAYTWTQSTADVRALTKATNNADRIASTYYTPAQMDLSFYFTDEQVHKLSIYSLDWDTNNTRTQTLELIDTVTGAVLDTRTINNFSNGVYTTWNVKGKVTVRVKRGNGPNAVISGVFINN